MKIFDGQKGKRLNETEYLAYTVAKVANIGQKSKPYMGAMPTSFGLCSRNQVR